MKTNAMTFRERITELRNELIVVNVSSSVMTRGYASVQWSDIGHGDN